MMEHAAFYTDAMSSRALFGWKMFLVSGKIFEAVNFRCEQTTKTTSLQCSSITWLDIVTHLHTFLLLWHRLGQTCQTPQPADGLKHSDGWSSTLV